MDVWCFEDDNNNSSSFSSLDENYVAEISLDEVVDGVEFVDIDLLNSSAGKINQQFNELNMLMDSTIFKQSQIGSFHHHNMFHHSSLQIPKEHSDIPINKSFSFDESSSNYKMTGRPMPPTSMVNQHSFPLAAIGEMALTRAMISVISSSSSTSSSSSATTSYQRAQTYQCQPNYYPQMSSFRPYRSLKPPIKATHNTLYSQNMIKRVHNMLRKVTMSKDKGKIEETQLKAYQMQHMVSERRRREKLNASFHSLWQLLPPGSKKDKTSVLCKTTSYLKTLKQEISEIEKKNKFLEQNLLPKNENYEMKEKNMDFEEKIEVHINKCSEIVSTEIQQIEIVIMVRVQCDLIKVLIHVFECIRGMKGSNLLSFDTVSSLQQMELIATLKLAIEGYDWDERTFKEAIAGAAHMALTMNH